MKVFTRLPLLFLFATIWQLAMSQAPHEIYTDSIGNVYVSPGTPINLYLATSADGQDAVKLSGSNGNSEVIIPTTHGNHRFTHYDAYLKKNITFNLFVDGLAPVTSAKLDNQQGYQNNDRFYISQSANLMLTSADANSGVKKIMFAINANAVEQYTQPLAFDQEGEYTLHYYAIDNVGNQEQPIKKSIIVDMTPPKTGLEFVGLEHEGVVASTTKLKLIPTDLNGIKETTYSLNGNSPKPYKDIISIAHLNEGEHSISWQSMDLAGNKESIQHVSFFIDKTPPMVFEELIGNTYMVGGNEFSSGRTQLRIAAIDNKSGIKEIYYSVNDEPYLLYEKPVFLSDISGAITIKSYALDNVGNKGVSNIRGNQFAMPKVDITGPNIKFITGKPQLTLRDTLWIGPNTKISIKAHDSQSGLNRVEYKIDKETPLPYTEGFTIKVPGVHTIAASAWDNVENLNISSITLCVDTIAPEIYTIFSVKAHNQIAENDQKIAVYDKGVTLFIAGTDDASGIDRITYSLNGSAPKTYSYPLSGFRVGQTHTLTVKATDRLGNQNESTITFRVE